MVEPRKNNHRAIYWTIPGWKFKLATGDTIIKKIKNKNKIKIKVKLATSITNIGTWNVRTLSRCGKLEELSRELDRYRWDVIGLAEIRWI